MMVDGWRIWDTPAIESICKNMYIFDRYDNWVNSLLYELDSKDNICLAAHMSRRVHRLATKVGNKS